MPIYEYRCDSCGARKDHLQKMHSAPLTTCPACGAESYVKLMSAAGFQLKGSGWYATDFKGNGAAPAAKAAETPKVDSAPAASCGGGCACHTG
jgi:putative FmdB family regulatory protein